MIRYLIIRLLWAIPILIGVTLFLFLLLSLTPGDAAQIALGPNASEAELEMYREQNGLDRPLAVQYLDYISKAFIGDLGVSLRTRHTVSSMIAARAGYTLFLSLTSMAVTIVVALVLGIVMAVKQNSIFDNAMRVLTLILTSMPQFWLALMMIMLFTVYLGVLPSTGLGTFKQAIMPIICIASVGITVCVRTTRAAMLEVLNQDYIRTARAKGLKRRFIIQRHALKNALLPMVTLYGRIISNCFAGSVIIENIFGIEGIGNMMMLALRQKDIPAIMGSIIICALVIIVVNLITDMLYAFIDPRIKSMYVRHKNKALRVVGDE